MNGLMFCGLLVLRASFAREPPKPPLIDIPNQGTIMGKEVSMIRTQRIMAYLGIPYAEAPLAELRFAPPRTDSLPSWEGVRNATELPPACLQETSDVYKYFLDLLPEQGNQEDEDCLYLNVFVPFGGHPPPEGYATIVWFHPGNFKTGNPAVWNPYAIVYRQRIIVVTFAYRLNIMGFFTSNDGEAPGNYGLMDQQAALTWVKNNIKLFGGNPDNVCVMGYGAGAVSIGLHMVNRQSYDLFSKAIMMSGNFLSPDAVGYQQEDKDLIARFTSNFGCYAKPTSALLDCLRRAPAKDLVTLTSYIDWKPLIDYHLNNNTPFLIDSPRNLFDRGEYYKVPLLTGYTDMEEVLFIPGLDIQEKPNDDVSPEYVTDFLKDLITKEYQAIANSTEPCVYNYDIITDAVLFFYSPTKPITELNEARKLITSFTTDKNFGSATYLHATYFSRDQPTYIYRFDTKLSTTGITPDITDWISVPHLLDLIYVWGLPYWAPLQDQDWDTRDKTTSEIIMSFWTSFAKTSNPTENSMFHINWDPFTKQDPKILLINRNFNISDASNFNYKSMEFWNDYFPKILNVALQCCSATDSANTLHKFYSFFSSSYVYVACSLISIVFR